MCSNSAVTVINAKIFEDVCCMNSCVIPIFYLGNEFVTFTNLPNLHLNLFCWFCTVCNEFKEFIMTELSTAQEAVLVKSTYDASKYTPVKGSGFFS